MRDTGETNQAGRAPRGGEAQSEESRAKRAR